MNGKYGNEILLLLWQRQFVGITGKYRFLAIRKKIQKIDFVRKGGKKKNKEIIIFKQILEETFWKSKNTCSVQINE